MRSEDKTKRIGSGGVKLGALEKAMETSESRVGGEAMARRNENELRFVVIALAVLIRHRLAKTKNNN